jgi:predicted RNA-binding Zn-ribbon protein involved in translation (DUF1610 family)
MVGVVKPYGLPPVFMPGATEEQVAHVQQTLDARHIFVTQYCKSKGWPDDVECLTIAQILEIREQDGWKNPVPNTPELELQVLIADKKQLNECALKFECPACHMSAGTRCFERRKQGHPEGHDCDPHPSRVRLAKRHLNIEDDDE